MLYGEKVLVSRYMTYGLVLVGSSIVAVIVAWTPVINALLRDECISFMTIAVTFLGNMVALFFTTGTLLMTILTWLERKKATVPVQVGRSG